MVKNSDLVYLYDTLTELPTVDSLHIISKISDFSIAEKENFVDLSGYSLSRKAKKSLKKANNYFSSGKYTKAFKLYTGLYESTKASKMLPLLAHCADLADKNETGLTYYKQLLLLAPKSPNILFAMANLEHKSGHLDAAIRHISFAHLFDRNNPVILDALISIFRSKGFEYQHISFEPRYQLLANPDSSIVIKTAGIPWQAFATCKAIWAHEPGYKEKMKFISSADVKIIEKKECLLSALLSYERLPEERANYPILATLSDALSEKRIDDFILYEITSKEHPAIMERLSEIRLEQMVDYIMLYKVRMRLN